MEDLLFQSNGWRKSGGPGVYWSAFNFRSAVA